MVSAVVLWFWCVVAERCGLGFWWWMLCSCFADLLAGGVELACVLRCMGGLGVGGLFRVAGLRRV